MSFRGSENSDESRGFALDLVAVVLITTIGIASVVSESEFGAVQRAVGWVFVLFAPGYAFVSLLLPQKTTGPPSGLPGIAASSSESITVTGAERVMLSVGLSVILVPLAGFFVHYTQLRVNPTSMGVAISGLTLTMTAIAAGRRVRIPPERRFGISGTGAARSVIDWVVVPDRSAHTALNIVLVVGLVVAVAGIGLAAATATTGEQYTELYLLSEGDETGELIADDYPSELTSGEQVSMHVGIENNEFQTETYTVVTQLQRVDGSGPDANVALRSELERFELTLEHGESTVQRSTAEPELQEDGLRLVYLLYVGEPPAQPTSENAYRSVHVWVDVGE